MMPSLFQGSAVALVTPFANGQVDTAAIERLVEMQIAGGTKAIVACGTTGEPTTMTADERELTVRTIVKAARGRVPVIAGTGSNCTQNVIDTARRYEDIGCAAQLVVTPYYNKTTQEGLYRHYMAIADNTALPIIIYNVPTRTALDISPEVLDRLACCEKFIAVKESSYNIPYVMDKIRHVGGRLAIYSGNDDTVIPLMALGAEGVISVVANVLPEMVARMATSYLAGEHAEALDLQLKLMPVICALFAEVSPIPCKAAMEMLGLCGGELRLPLVPIGDGNREKLRDALISVGLNL
ncbi:MAG: 4-hydroxy-tetrahydrodipicolinate synthase [Candidatus Limiplasma sp.]|nr:4-hydroxy-tetrahydrodipicolinate synthase [Candidatus Limiplasma sp.]MEA5145770.1 4-hydroxy-tetrahydrodipicolinate synthase [Candidatus Limiplasma sp.]